MVGLNMRQTIRRTLNRVGFDIVRLPSAKKDLYFEADDKFAAIYDDAVRATGGPEQWPFPHRLYNTVQFLRSTRGLSGAVAECGTYKGRSSYVFCRFMQVSDPAFTGQNYFVFDSFEGLSEPTEEDRVSEKEFGDLGSHTQAKHAFCGSLSEVQAALSGFPNVTYCRGWIPESLATVPDRLYKFVHLDLDLYEPIKGALEYFYPRLVHGGVIVVDEYGFPRWPGARKAVDEFCSGHGRTPVGLTTGNGVIVKA
jgi:O-methyltransferase